MADSTDGGKPCRGVILQTVTAVERASRGRCAPAADRQHLRSDGASHMYLLGLSTVLRSARVTVPSYHAVR